MIIGGNNGGYWNAYQAIYGSAYQALAQQLAMQTFGAGLPGAALSGEAEALARAYKTIKDTGVEFGETIGWRCWMLKRGLLHSVHMGTVWLPNEPVTSGGGDIQAFGDGIHAFKTAGQALKYYGWHREAVIGRVALWGEIVEHERGYVAENAYPATFDLLGATACSFEPRLDCKALNKLRNTYGLDLVHPRDMDKELRATWRHRLVARLARVLRC